MEKKVLIKKVLKVIEGDWEDREDAISSGFGDEFDLCKMLKSELQKERKG